LQACNPQTEQWVRRDAEIGRFLDVKQDGDSFKGVRRALAMALMAAGFFAPASLGECS